MTVEVDPPSVAVLIVDDEVLYRHAAASVVRATPGFQVVGEAGSGGEAVRLAAVLEPALVLMDINMTGIDGIEACRRITSRQPRIAVVLLSTYVWHDLPSEAHSSGMTAYINKGDFGPQVLADLWAVHRS